MPDAGKTPRDREFWLESYSKKETHLSTQKSRLGYSASTLGRAGAVHASLTSAAALKARVSLEAVEIFCARTADVLDHFSNKVVGDANSR